SEGELAMAQSHQPSEADTPKADRTLASPAGEFGADSESTCWTVIKGAAAGNPEDRDYFARIYAPVVRGYLAARWRATPYWQEPENASQEVFIECFKEHGALDRCQPGYAGGFRAFLYGVVRHVALRIEARLRNQERQLPDDSVINDIPEPEEHLSQVFDRAWAVALVREARRRLSERARRKGEAALRRGEPPRPRVRP